MHIQTFVSAEAKNRTARRMPKCLSTHQYTSGTSRRKNSSRPSWVIARNAPSSAGELRAWSASTTPTPHKTEADARRPDDDDRVGAFARQAFPRYRDRGYHAGWLRKLKALRAARRWYPRPRPAVLPALVVGARPLAGVQVSTEGPAPSRAGRAGASPHRGSLALSSPSCSRTKARMSSAMARSFSHCSL